MIPNKNHSTLNSTKSDTHRMISPSTVLRQSLSNVCSKFCTSQTYYMTNHINMAIQNKKCRLKWMMKDEEYNQEEEILEQYYTLEQAEQQLPELTEYYKYYTQTSIMYQMNFFKLMHQHRQKKKVIQYNRLKVILNLSQTTQNSEDCHLKQKACKNTTPISSFYILSKLYTNQLDDDQQTLAKLNNKLQKTLGPNCYRTVEELDRNYHFQKKMMQPSLSLDIRLDIKCFKKIKMQKENQMIKSTKLKTNKRNNSCQLINNSPSKKKTFDFKHKHLKKKNFSMDNLSTLVKDYQIKETKEIKPKLLGNWVKGTQCKPKLRNSLQKYKSQQNEKDYNIKSKILDVKERIRKQKLQLKKKNTLATNQSQIMSKNSKKITIQTKDKQNPNRKLAKIIFF